jgi:hypothetical protein
VLEHLLPGLRVQHLRVPLHPGKQAVQVLERRHRRALGPGQHGEPGRRCMDGVAVRHPHVQVLGYAGQQRARSTDGDRGAAELAQPGPAHVPAERLRHRLEPVTDPERRHPGLEQTGVHSWGSVGVHRLGPSGQDDRLGLARKHLVDRHRVRHDLGVHLGLAHPPGDQLRVLGAEVDDQDRVV